VTDFPVVNVHVDELSSARTWQHKLCATYSANVNTNNLFQSKYTTVSVLRDKQRSVKHYTENTNLTKTVGELRCSGRVAVSAKHMTNVISFKK
jgi:hypothetical protein